MTAAFMGIAAGYAASLLPSLYANAQFWTSSPAFFFIRLGIVTAMLAGAWFLGLAWEPLVTTGPLIAVRVLDPRRDGVRGTGDPAQRLLPWEASVLATFALCGVLYWLVPAEEPVDGGAPAARPLVDSCTDSEVAMVGRHSRARIQCGS